MDSMRQLLQEKNMLDLNDPDLRDRPIQAWMQSVITHPGHLSQSAHTAYQQFDLAPHKLIK